MTSEPKENVNASARRTFAAKYEHRGWGIALAIIGGLALLGGSAAIGPALAGTSSSNPIPSMVVGVGLSVWSVYLLRGQGISPAVARRKAEQEQQKSDAAQRQAAEAAASMEQATAALAAVSVGGAAVVAYRNLWETAKRWHAADAPAAAAAAVQSTGIDATGLAAAPLGTVNALAGGRVEFFQEWVIFGQKAFDVDASTRGQVFVDGSIQVTSATVLDKKGRSQIVNTEHDMRTAQLQLSGTGWSVGIPILPTQANEARRLVDQLLSHVETLKPKQATAADIRTMVEMILANTGQPVAEKLQQLSHLRFERLLSDDEFESAKTRILGLQ